MKIKKINATELIVEIKPISWIGTFGILSILLALIYFQILEPILKGKFEPSILPIFLFFMALCLLGLTIALSTERWHFNRHKEQIAHIQSLLFSKVIKAYFFHEIEDITVEKEVDDDDDGKGAKYCIYALLKSGKKVEIGSEVIFQEKNVRAIAQAIQEFLH